MSAKFPRGGGGGSRTFFSSKSIRPDLDSAGPGLDLTLLVL